MSDGSNRRDVIKAALALGGLAVASGCKRVPKTARWIAGGPEFDPVADYKMVRTVCLMCHSACGIQVKVHDGVAVKIEGNPYHPNVMEPHLPYDTDPVKANRIGGTICAKGGAALQTLYNPRRIQHPLKRVGPRGSGKWKTITWETAYREIIEGGDLFGQGHVDGLRAIRRFDTIDPESPGQPVVFHGRPD